MTQPSLTPHRDSLEQVIADFNAPQNWIEAMAIAMTLAVQRMVADQLDAGKQREDILIVMPTVFRIAAINALAAVRAPGPIANAPVLLRRAAQPEAEPEKIVIRESPSASFADGGRA